MDNSENLTSGRHKKCGYSAPIYDKDGHYDDVRCEFKEGATKFCGDIDCPLDREPPDTDDGVDDAAQKYHGEDKGYD